MSGRGVRVCVLDDGLEHQHDDLRDNYVREWVHGRKINVEWGDFWSLSRTKKKVTLNL